MITRRDTLKWGGALGALATSGASLAATGGPDGGVDAFLLDERYAAFDEASHLGPRVMRFAGDITPVWYGELDQRWRERGFVLGGVTGSDSLFLLEMLAAQQGRRVTYRKQLGKADTRGVYPVSWIIAPVHPSVLP